MIGYHLIVDGAYSNSPNSEDLETILSELPGKIGMNILAGPLVVKGCPENPGWTGFVIIDKSHISIHTFDEGNRISLDVFSCQLFEENSVMNYIHGKIQFSKFRVRFIERNEDP